MPTKEKIVLFACGGDLPKTVAQTLKSQNKDYFIIGFKGHTDPIWVSQHPSTFVNISRVGAVLKILKKQHATSVIFAGDIRRPSWADLSLDFTGMWWLYQFKKTKNQGDDALLKFIAGKLEDKGYRVLGAQDINNGIVTHGGVYTHKKPTAEEWHDISQGAWMAKQIGALDVGQSIVIQQGIFLGVEAIEGTDALIERAGTLKRSGYGPILVKLSKPQQDQRVDLPTIGDKTVQNVIQAGFSGIVIEAGKSFFLNHEEAVSLANDKGIFIVALTSDQIPDSIDHNDK